MPTTYWFLRNSIIETFGHRLRRKPTNEKCKALQHALIGLVAKLEWRLHAISKLFIGFSLQTSETHWSEWLSLPPSLCNHDALKALPLLLPL